MVAQVSQMGMSVVDVVMAGQYGAEDLAGVGLGTGLYWPVMLLLTGTLLAVTPTIAQLYGAGRLAETSAVARQAIWLGAFLGVVVFFVLRNAEPVYRLLEVDPRAIPISVEFLRAQSYGIFGLLGYLVLRNLSEGLGLTVPTMVIVLSALVLKVPLTYVLVFGMGDFQGLGGVGCGWATAITMWIQFLGALVAVRVTRIANSGFFRGIEWPNWTLIGRLVRLGLPMGGTIFIEVSFFSAVTLLIGRLGVEAVAAHQIAMNVASIGFMIPLALSLATTIRVGAVVGAENYRVARRTMLVAMMISLLVGLGIAIVLLVGRVPIVSLYSDDSSVLSTAAALLLMCAFFQLFDASQVTAIGTLRGFKDAAVPMVLVLLAYWIIGMPIGATLAFGIGTFEGMGVVGFWWGLIAGLALAALMLLARVAWVAKNIHEVAERNAQTREKHPTQETEESNQLIGS